MRARRSCRYACARQTPTSTKLPGLAPRGCMPISFPRVTSTRRRGSRAVSHARAQRRRWGPRNGYEAPRRLAEDFDGAARVHLAEALARRGTRGFSSQVRRRSLRGASRIAGGAFRGRVARGEWSAVAGPSRLCVGAIGRWPALPVGAASDRMLTFRQEDAEYRREMLALIAENEAGARKPLTGECSRFGWGGSIAMRRARLPLALTASPTPEAR